MCLFKLNNLQQNPIKGFLNDLLQKFYCFYETYVLISYNKLNIHIYIHMYIYTNILIFLHSGQGKKQEADVQPGDGHQGVDGIAEAEDRLQEGTPGCEGPAQDEAGHIGKGVQVLLIDRRRFVGESQQKEEE